MPSPKACPSELTTEKGLKRSPSIAPEATSRQGAYYLNETPACVEGEIRWPARWPLLCACGATPEPPGVDMRRRSAGSESTDTSVGFEDFRLLRVELRLGQDS